MPMIPVLKQYNGETLLGKPVFRTEPPQSVSGNEVSHVEYGVPTWWIWVEDDE